MSATMDPRPSPPPGYFPPVRRHGVSWATFWFVVAVVAVLSLLFGVAIGAVTGAAWKHQQDQEAICEAEGPLARFNDAC